MSHGSLIVLQDDLHSYLLEIGRHPLLTVEEEQKYGTLAQRLMFIKSVETDLAKSLDREPSITELAEKLDVPVANLQREIYQGNTAAQKMVQSNLRLVVSIAKKYLNRGVAFLDLIQEGNIGLLKAVEKFDPSRKYRFSTYAYWWIRQGITRAIASSSRTVRLPVHLVERISKVKEATRNLTQTLQRSPTEVEVAKALGYTVEDLRKLKSNARNPISLNAKINSDPDGEEIGALIENDRELSPEEATQRSIMKDQIEKAFESLDERSKTVLSLRFGLENGKTWTLDQIGQQFNLTREGVRQIERRALQELKRKHQPLLSLIK